MITRNVILGNGRVHAEFRDGKGGNIISDHEIIIPSLPKEIKLCKITALDPETKKRIVLLTNNLK